jgi:hypothetical protein
MLAVHHRKVDEPRHFSRRFNPHILMDRSNRLLVIAGALIASGAALRLPGLWTDLQLDEVWSLENAVAANSWLELLRLKIDNNHHLTSLYMYALGPEAAAAVYRMPAYLAGVAAIPLAWLIGSRDSRATAIVTSVLFAFSAALIFYSSEARGYSAAVFLMLSGWYCLQRYAESTQSQWLIGFAVSSVAGVMSHQTFVLFYAGAFIWCDAHMQRHHRLRAATRLTIRIFAIPSAAIGLFAIIALVGQQIGGGLPFDLPVIVAQTLTAVVGGPQNGLGLWLAAVFVGSITVAAVWSAYRLGDDRWLLYVAAGVIAPLIIVLMRRPPTLAPRYFLVPAAVMLLGVARFLALAIEHGSARRTIAQTLIGVHMLAGVWFTFSANASRGDYRAALNHIVEQSNQITTIASTNRFGGSDWRTAMMVRYYGRAIGARERLRYIPAEQAAAEAAEWAIDESPDNTPAPKPIRNAQGREYTIDGTYPSGPLSGITWRVYRQNHSQVLDPR